MALMRSIARVHRDSCLMQLNQLGAWAAVGFIVALGCIHASVRPGAD